ncbi:hypothetical protein A2875_00950 [Candidatus Gottesmanbacteria bacterium RIFCSPHIGHO2_01_FULL_46_14]|uniref:Uncharacterized protein n=1 Tax=Candidatus Gottesmanbacteria bacterium RIFCSPHIGHO2_01_FULL_46_14 TaxID=1798380 RepID=A0A1F5ZN70_9BACT|nr:MAG: hypothetical protein A2875_00950 [Candidatus Gottesmanbacteria bacterium RIFCSPHIGHO2_01_FULL_46_14]
MILRDILLFLTIIVAMMFYAHAEAYMEGKNGWTWNPAWWRIKLPNGYTYTAYHVYAYYLTFPLLVFGLPLLLVGWNTHLMLVLSFSYIIGTGVEDFTWFVVNPLYPFGKWNPRQTRWYPWVSIGRFSLPLSYVARGIFCAALFFFIYRDWMMVR